MSELVAQATALLGARAGLDAALLPARGIERHLRERCCALGLADPAALLERLATSGEELERLLDAVVVPETWFFRDWEPFSALQRLAAARPGRWRALSLGCSTGEEAYSIAMALLAVPGVEPAVDAVDVSPAALARAAEASYGRAAFREPRWTAYEGCFAEEGRGRRRVRAHVRERVRLRHGNALAPVWAEGTPAWDVVFCRNLLIYLDELARARVIATLDRVLAPGGMLVLGHAEATSVLVPTYRALPEPRAFAAVKPASGAPPPAPGAPLPVSGAPPPARAAWTDAADIAGREERPTAPVAAAEDPRLAESRCRAVLDRDPLDVGAHVVLASLAADTGRAAEAEEWLRRALYLAPDNADALARMAALLEGRGRAELAARFRARERRVRGVARA